MFQRFLEWLGELLGFRAGFDVVADQEAPDVVKGRTLYLVGDSGHYWLAIMKCPCGCGDVINLPMSPGARPCWRALVHNGKPTLNPSVHRTTGCRSHFILRAGRVVWCR